MYLLPVIFNDNWTSRPSRTVTRHLDAGLDFDDFLSPINYTVVRLPANYCRPQSSEAVKSRPDSTIQANKDKFQVNIDVQQFKPEEITVKVSGDNTIIVEGKHEEKQDQHGFVSRHFVRRYVLPEGHDINNVMSNLSSDGVLSITAPCIENSKKEQRTIPIQQTGVPSKPLQNKGEDKAEPDQKKDEKSKLN